VVAVGATTLAEVVLATGGALVEPVGEQVGSPLELGHQPGGVGDGAVLIVAGH
jgi:hypothetical protein